MTGYEIKLLHAGDEAVLAQVVPEVFDLPIDRESAIAFLADPRHHIAVAVAEGHVIGFASGVHYFHPDKPIPELFINEVGVAPAYHRRGIGRGVVEALLEAGRALGCGQAWVLTERHNVAGMGLYADRGGRQAPHDPVMFTIALDDEQL